MVAPGNDTHWVQRERERVRAWRSRKSAAGRDIGRLPPIADPARRRACKFDLALFCRTYFRKTFGLPFSKDHLTVITQIERACLEGGLFALAMPRGSGKTTLCEIAALWAVLYGHHHYVMLVGATAKKAAQLLDSIKTELRSNEVLLADFPEVCFPIHALEGITNRAAGQRFNGQATLIGWKRDEIVCPTIADSQASGAIIQAVGITGTIRGGKFKTPDGDSLRPTFVIVDDPQTDKSAKSPGQCESREATIKQAILGLPGPGESIAVVMPCTVIVEGDLADRMLNRTLNPDWNGIRTKTLYKFPTNEELWAEYWEIYMAGLLKEDGGKAAAAFYRKHRKELDAGAEVAWPERFKKGEVSAIQSAMNRHLTDRYAFAAEYQNEPLTRNPSALVKILTATEIADKINRCPRGQVPAGCTVLTSFVDTSQDVLWWMICGWSPDFGGGIVDYGTWPDQNRTYFTLTDLRTTIGDALPHIADLEARIYAAAEACNAELHAREYVRQDGVALRISLGLRDAGWKDKPIYAACRQSQFASSLLPSHGKGIGVKNKPISQYQHKEGEQIGEEWVRRATSRRGIGHVIFDANYWKTFVHARLLAGMGARGCLSLPGDSPHRMLADHLVAEKVTRVSANGRTVDEWTEYPHRPDNHWLDGLVGCAVGASIMGCSLLKHTAGPPKPKKPRRRNRVTYLD